MIAAEAAAKVQDDRVNYQAVAIQQWSTPDKGGVWFEYNDQRSTRECTANQGRSRRH